MILRFNTMFGGYTFHKNILELLDIFVPFASNAFLMICACAHDSVSQA